MDVKGPKDRLSRRFGINLSGTTSRSLDRRLNQPPGIHGAKRRRKPSQYGEQLLEKQKVRAIYGVKERQFRHYFEEASRVAGRPGENLMRLLELRLDNVVYRSGFSTSRRQARQLVNHGHIEVNGRKVNIPSFQVKQGDVISVKDKSHKNAHVEGAWSTAAGRGRPGWITPGDKDLSIAISGLPTRQDIDQNINEQLIVELYSK